MKEDLDDYCEDTGKQRRKKNKRHKRCEKVLTEETLAKKLKPIGQKLDQIKTKETKMAQSIEQLRAAIQDISVKVDADVAQDTKVLEAIEALIKKIEESGNTDFTAEVEALSAVSTKLSSDNDAVQAAIDKAVPPVA